MNALPLIGCSLETCNEYHYFFHEIHKIFVIFELLTKNFTIERIPQGEFHTQKLYSSIPQPSRYVTPAPGPQPRLSSWTPFVAAASSRRRQVWPSRPPFLGWFPTWKFKNMVINQHKNAQDIGTLQKSDIDAKNDNCLRECIPLPNHHVGYPCWFSGGNLNFQGKEQLNGLWWVIVSLFGPACSQLKNLFPITDFNPEPFNISEYAKTVKI